MISAIYIIHLTVQRRRPALRTALDACFSLLSSLACNRRTASSLHGKNRETLPLSAVSVFFQSRFHEFLTPVMDFLRAFAEQCWLATGQGISLPCRYGCHVKSSLTHILMDETYLRLCKFFFLTLFWRSVIFFGWPPKEFSIYLPAYSQVPILSTGLINVSTHTFQIYQYIRIFVIGGKVSNQYV